MPIRARRRLIAPARTPAAGRRGLTRAEQQGIQQISGMPLGNQIMQHLLRSGAAQAKLTVNQPGDSYEEEADRVADEVVRRPEPEAGRGRPTLTARQEPGPQRRCASCAAGEATCSECADEEDRVQKETTGAAVTAPSLASSQISIGEGQPLLPSIRAELEPRFGHDLGQVRIHTSPRAAESAHAIGAAAFTSGHDIVFGAGQHNPETASGRRLLAHELTHVIQQTEGRAGLPVKPLIQRQPQGGGAAKSGCPNQGDVDGVIKKNPRGYGPKVEMYTHTITTGDVFSKLASATVADNKVAGAQDLSKELQALNKGIAADTIGNCVVLIKGWVSPAWTAKQKRVRCDERIDTFKKDKAYSAYTAWEQETVTKDDNAYEPIVERVAKRHGNLFKGRKPEYAKVVKTLNEPWIGSLNEGECVALPVGWTDPNIGKLPAKPAEKAALTGEAAQAAATVYAEQTGSFARAEEQRKFIWLSIRKRVETEVRGPSIAKVLPGEYDGYGNKHYDKAIEDLKNPTPTIAEVASAKKVVLDNWTGALPKGAGAFYFHWRTDSTFLESCYGKPKEGKEAEKEKECAWKWAGKNAFAGTVTKSAGWHHRIRGKSPDERFGSMYIYP